jgi:hypothetical protein
MSRMGGNYWIKTSTIGAIKVLVRLIPTGIGGNVVASLAAACVLWAGLGGPLRLPPPLAKSLAGGDAGSISRRIRRPPFSPHLSLVSFWCY